MKQFLLKYDLNYNRYKGLFKLVCANSFEDAVLKLEKEISKMTIGDFCKPGSVVIVGRVQNLTI